jgi:hypothetical protein
MISGKVRSRSRPVIIVVAMLGISSILLREAFRTIRETGRILTSIADREGRLGLTPHPCMAFFESLDE